MNSRTSVVTITQSLKGHGILGTDVRDIHAQKDRWLAESPSIKIIEDGDIKRDPQSPLCVLAESVPRFSCSCAIGKRRVGEMHQGFRSRRRRKAKARQTVRPRQASAPSKISLRVKPA